MTGKQQTFKDMAENLSKLIALKKRQIDLLDILRKMAVRAANNEPAALARWEQGKQSNIQNIFQKGGES